MKNTKIIGIFLLTALTISICLILNLNKENKVTLDEVVLKGNINNMKGMAIFVEQNDGEYAIENELPLEEDGYIFNEDKSGCMDDSGLIIKDVLKYHDSKIEVKTKSSTKCYLYFDILAMDEPAVFDYTGSVQMFEAPMTGTYKLEVWGAQGGNCAGFGSGGDNPYVRSGGLGGYSEGNVTLTKGQIIYVFVGGQGDSVELDEYGVKYTKDDGTTGYKEFSEGGYNGGGNAKQTLQSGKQYSGGGGATHIGTFNSTLKEHGSTEGLYIVAGGGGGTGAVYDGGQNPANGGAGGGLTGGNPIRPNSTEVAEDYEGTQDGPGGVEKWYSNGQGTGAGGFGYGGDTTAIFAGGGGGGLYGGAGGTDYWAGGGGSGYIGGVTTGETKSGTESMPTHDGTGTMTGNAGNGYAKISFVN